MPLVSTAEIATSAPYPPSRERGRVNRMDKYSRWSDGHYQGLLPPVKAGEDNRLQPNLFRWLMHFWRDAIMADAPVLEYDGTPRQLEFITALKPSIIESSRLLVPDLVRYGTGVFINRKVLNVQMVDPRFWFPVRAPYDNSEGAVDIIAYPYAEGNVPATSDRSDKDSFKPTLTQTPSGTPLPTGELYVTPDRMNITLYENGRALRVLHKFSGQTIGQPIAGTEVELPAGMPAVVSVTEGEGFYGTSDFEDIWRYVAEMHRRETGLSVALDRNVNPHLAVPEGVMQQDAEGRYVLSSDGNVIPVPEGASPPAYVTWNPSFEAAQEAIRRARSRILQFTSVAPILIDAEQNSQALPSGAALRRMAIPTVNRIRAIRDKLTEAIKDVCVGQSVLFSAQGGEQIAIERDRVSLQWPPELSGGMTDEADAIAVLVGAGVLEQETAIQLLSKVTRAEAEDIANASEQTVLRKES